jgi:hypothetical protein
MYLLAFVHTCDTVSLNDTIQSLKQLFEAFSDLDKIQYLQNTVIITSFS